MESDAAAIRLRARTFCGEESGVSDNFLLLLWRRQQQGVISKFKCRLMFCFIFLCCGTVSILSKGVAKLEMHWFAVVMSYRLLVNSSGTSRNGVFERGGYLRNIQPQLSSKIQRF